MSCASHARFPPATVDSWFWHMFSWRQELLMNEIHALMDLDHPNVATEMRLQDKGFGA